MKHSIFALPALLRPAFILAVASQSSFSVQDDLLAFPQYEVKFSEDYVSESQAHSRLLVHEQLHDTPLSQVEQYQPSDSRVFSSDGREEGEKLGYEHMILDGQPYLCSIPQVEKVDDKSAVNDTLSKVEEEKELARATDRGWELLSGMQGNCVYYISGWWSYRFCYNDGVRQFHQLPPSRGLPVYPPVEDPGVEAFTLGMYQQDDATAVKSGQEQEANSAIGIGEATGISKSSAGSGQIVQRGESRYLVQRLSGGTKCDLTGKDRRIEVQFHCHPQATDRISLIKETSTCAYLMVIQTPRLCNDVAFLPPQKDQPNTISCSLILGEDQVEDYKQDLKALKNAEKEAQIWQANPDAAKLFQSGTQENVQIVGDIVLGGRAVVPESVTLEKSAIVGGGKETYIDTVASSAGTKLSKEDLEKLGLGDPRAVENLKKRLEEIAEGQEWKLDVIDTPRGREYRGIIGTEQNKQEKDGDKEQGEDGEKEKEKEEVGSKEEYYADEL